MFEEALRQPVKEIKDGIGVEKFVYVGASPAGHEIPFEDFIEPGVDREPEADVGWHDPAFIIYTSGTTGRPKGAVRSHLADFMGGMCISLECGFRQNDVILNNKPLFHIAQLQLQFVPFVQNAATNVMTRGFDVHETLSLVGAERVTVLHGVPTGIGNDGGGKSLGSTTFPRSAAASLAARRSRTTLPASAWRYSRAISPMFMAPPKH